MFDRPSINLGRIQGGDALNKVPDAVHDGGRHALPARARSRTRSSRRSRAIPECQVTRTFIHPPVNVSRAQPLRARAARRGGALDPDGEVMSVGRDGASDAAAFIGGRDPGGRVRPRRRRPPRPRGVGVGLPRWRATAARSAISSARCRCGSSGTVREAAAVDGRGRRSRGRSGGGLTAIAGRA